MSRFLTLLLTMIPGLAFAQNDGGPPYAFSTGVNAQMIRPGIPSECTEALAPTTQRPVARSGVVVAGSSDGLACYNWGTKLRIHCTTDTRIAFVQSATVTFGTTADPYNLADPEGGTGTLIGPTSGKAAQASYIQDDTWMHHVVGAAPWRYSTTPTFRSLRCDSGNADTKGHPCNEDSDCGSGGACDVREKAECVFLILEATTTEGTCQVCQER